MSTEDCIARQSRAYAGFIIAMMAMVESPIGDNGR